MKFRNFIIIIKEKVQDRMGIEYFIEIKETVKNNNVVMTGLSIKAPYCNIAPIIYLEPYFGAYQSGISLNEVIDKIIDTYKRNSIPSGKYDMSFLMEYEKVKNNIIFKMINKDRNEEVLKNVPYVEYFDLALIFQYMVSSDAVITINNAHIKMWNVTTDVLYKQALKNTPVLKPYNIMSLQDMIQKLYIKCGINEKSNETLCPYKSVYVLTNVSEINGACCIVYPQLLKDFAETLDNDFFMIPASIHEWILVGTSEFGDDVNELLDIVKFVNENEV